MKSALDLDTRTPFEWEPCPKCSERLEYGTNGMGRVVTICPVCDWGHKPAREYDLFRQRMAELPQPEPDFLKPSGPARNYKVKTCFCGTPFQPNNSRQTHCGTKCRDAWLQERRNANRANGLCRCGRELVTGYRSCELHLAFNTARRRKSSRTRTYWQNKGAA
jgi:hypothetical protein